MKTLKELKKEITGNEELRKAYSEAIRSGKTTEFLKAQGVDATEEDLKAFLKNGSGEISDEELDNVAGGGCGSTGGEEMGKCIYCGSPMKMSEQRDGMHPDCYKKFHDVHDPGVLTLPPTPPVR